ncbi:MAG: dephospho-CoA kinase [Gammaproteobacteria bacterium]|nr:dephospho-CoA kinase [Gammaproteobacteria bacterium]
MLIVGLTGGIGAGKSTVAELFQALGVPVLDADAIARELVDKGKPALTRLTEMFGREILDDNGALNRTRLRTLVFNDAAQRRQLEALLHPLIREEMQARLKRLKASYCIVCIPLLVETGQTASVQRVLVIDAPDELRRRRVVTRDGLTAAEFNAVLAAQAGREERLAAADDVIVNDGGRDRLKQRVDELHRRYMQLAAPASASNKV